ncbi:synaptonemal complex central element protein 1 isoform X1 [Lepisosteus oculatus]|uniref:synaptonemal complex central element protein 1 isoform X1 n=1 Tax=Lepisosteus oculatus TaxID=7918 RepID=UPI00073FDEF9|nr:PREDICTED: synaptonemal complex central element protein 1-like isoform X1 [Lepisosteus oculatus]
MEDILQNTEELKDGDKAELKMEDLMNKLRKLQKGKTALEEELKEGESLKKTLKEELDALHTERSQLEKAYREKEDACKTLQYQCELKEDTNRGHQLNSEHEQLLEEYTFKIQEAKLKHRKQRMKFENQLQQLLEDHKNMYSIYSPERLPVEIENAENANAQLLKAEQIKLLQLKILEEEITRARGLTEKTSENKEN